jgi:S-adenosylmethionine hydrolase
MKGVMLGICPDLQLIDITHDIAPQSIAGGALALDAAARYFPAGTIFLCVVDPGVGSPRRALAGRSARHAFVGPDNGLLTPLLEGDGPSEVVELTNARYRLPEKSATFEGRDRFAPAAAWLACGVALGELGPRVADPQVCPIPSATREGDTIVGEVIAVDRFGNLITSVSGGQLPPGELIVTVAGARAGSVVTTYANAPLDGACALVGSSDRLEIAVRNGSAAARFGAGVGAPVLVRSAA